MTRCLFVLISVDLDDQILVLVKVNVNICHIGRSASEYSVSNLKINSCAVIFICRKI